jgi:hypothetical protein
MDKELKRILGDLCDNMAALEAESDLALKKTSAIRIALQTTHPEFEVAYQCGFRGMSISVPN